MIGRRAVVASALALAPGAALATARPVRFDIVVGQGEVKTLGQAFEVAPQDGARPFHILLPAGTWEEKVVLTKPNVRLWGESRRQTILTYGASAGQEKPGGGRWGTGGSGTLIVRAPDFQARDLTIRNHFDYLRELRDPQGNGAQAVALMLDRGADRAVVERADILGHQDTLYVQERALFRDCLITGSVDFIFGGGAVVFTHCEVRSRTRPGQEVQGYLAAPSTLHDRPYGFVFDRCRLTREVDLPDRSVWLGRPWRAGGDPKIRGSAVFLACWMDAHITDEGWTSMGFSSPDGQRLQLRPEEARFAEYDSRGPGARRHSKRPQLRAAEAKLYDPGRVLDGWRPLDRF
jgi:pectinesterase